MGVVARSLVRPAEGRRRRPRPLRTQPALTPSPDPFPVEGKGRGARGINGVPAVVVEGKGLISGGQPAAVFEEALRGIWREG